MLIQRLTDWQPVGTVKDQAVFSIRTGFSLETIGCMQDFFKNAVIALSQVAFNCLIQKHAHLTYG